MSDPAKADPAQPALKYNESAPAPEPRAEHQSPKGAFAPFMQGALQDDPERHFRRLPRLLKRLTPSVLWRRARLPLRRRRWMAENAAATAAWRKPALAAPPEGPRAAALGDFSGENGISRAALYELARLSARHPGLEVIDAGPAMHAGRPLAPAEGPPLDRLYLLSAPDTYATVLPALPPARAAQAWRTGLWVWETPHLGPDWGFAFDIVHEIWTPSAYSAAAIAPAAAPHGIAVSGRPHAVPPPAAVGAAAAAAIRARYAVPADAFLGLAVMDSRSCPARKNPWAHVAAWAAAFGPDPARRLILKIRLSKRTACVRDELAEMIATAPNIRVIEDYLAPAEMDALQAAADVYLSLHRAEGYGLNIHEMLARETPVVATDWSANAEYGPDFAAYHPVPARLVPYRDWTAHYPGARFSWAEPDIAAAAAALRRIAAASDATPRRIAAVSDAASDTATEAEKPRHTPAD